MILLNPFLYKQKKLPNQSSLGYRQHRNKDVVTIEERSGGVVEKRKMDFQRLEDAASGRKKAEFVLKHAKIVNVFTEEVEEGDIAIHGNRIVGIGEYDGEKEVDLCGAVVCPGLIDGHIHLESSMVTPREFEKAVLPHGTTAVVTDPHEIANVAGTEGIQYMLSETENLCMDVFFMMPSCVPATELDESGAKLLAQDLEYFYQNPRVLGLAEVMDAGSVICAEKSTMDKLEQARNWEKRIDGHAPFLSGKELNAYVTAGVRSDHECSCEAEAMEKMRRGQWIMIREGTAAHNLEALMGLFQAPYCYQAMLVTDDKHPNDLLHLGHIDAIIKKAVHLGADPIKAVKMGSFHAAQYFGLFDRGAVAPGYRADLVIVSDLENFEIRGVYKDGRLAAKNGHVLEERKSVLFSEEERKRVMDSFHMPELTEKMLHFPIRGSLVRTISLIPHELLTKEEYVKITSKEGENYEGNPKQDVVKLAVAERHKNTGHIGIGFLKGYGLKYGAVASSIAHDSHNLIIAGTNDRDMALAGQCVKKNGGGLAVVADGEILGSLPLPIAGLMSDQSLEWVDERLESLKAQLRKMGIPEEIDPFMTLAFVSLPVIPKLRLNTYGLIDVEEQKCVDVYVDEKRMEKRT